MARSTMTRDWTLVTLLVLGLGACSQGGGSTGGSLNLVSCSLGCTAAGVCSVSSIASNQPIKFIFDGNIDAASVNTGTLQVSEVSSGVIPSGSFSVSGNTITFVPAIVFDPFTGAPKALGTQPIAINIPALPNKVTIFSQGGGQLNGGIQCTVVPDGSFIDPVEGPPFVQLVSPAQSANVDSSQTVVLEFNDLMNVQTIFEPGSGTSPSIFLEIDPDGDVATTSDRIAVPALFALNFPSPTITQVIIQPLVPPSGANGLLNVLTVLPSAKDLVGNDLANPGIFSYTTAPLPSDDAQTVISESFVNNIREDLLRSGAFWNLGGSQKLVPSAAGGLGFDDLIVSSGSTLNLDADNILFEKPSFTPSGLSCNPSAQGFELGYLPITVNNDCEEVSFFRAIASPLTLEDVALTKGILPVQSFQVVNGGMLRSRSSANPLRIFVQGLVDIRGEIDLDGDPGGDESFTDNPAVDAGGEGGSNGPGAGSGGVGGDAPDVVAAVVDGADGEGIGGSAPGSLGSGKGSPAKPANADDSLIEINLDYGISNCGAAQAVGGGGGGGNATSGAAGGIVSVVGDPGPAGAGGGASPADPFADPYGAAFQGGAGGGGSGTTARLSGWTAFQVCMGLFGNPCSNPGTCDLAGLWGPSNCIGDPSTDCIGVGFLQQAGCCQEGTFNLEWHAGAGGGGGGGALLLQSGGSGLITGSVHANGGQGGGGVSGGAGAGGGSGGTIYIQSQKGLQMTSGALSAIGGDNGLGLGVGGGGGTGRIRLEEDGSLTGNLLSGLDFTTLSDPLPEVGSLAIPAACATFEWDDLTDGAPPVDLSTACLDKMSTAVSKYYKVDGSFLISKMERFELDVTTNAGPQTLLFPQDASTPLGSTGQGIDLLLHNAPLGIYFQGADDDGQGNPVSGSQTPFFLDPRLIADGMGKALIRFVIVFDGSFPALNPAKVLSVEELRFVIKAQ